MNEIMIPRKVTVSDDGSSTNDYEVSPGTEMYGYPEITIQDPTLAHDYMAALSIIVHQEEYQINTNAISSQLQVSTRLENVTGIVKPSTPSQSISSGKPSVASPSGGRMQALAKKLGRQLAAYRATSEHVREKHEQVIDALANFKASSASLRSSVKQFAGGTASQEKASDE